MRRSKRRNSRNSGAEDEVVANIQTNNNKDAGDSLDMNKPPKKQHRKRRLTATEGSEEENPKSSRPRARVAVELKGRVAVDYEMDEQIRKEVHVFTEPNTVWDVMLNQTNVIMNNNNFFLIQLLQSDTDNKYWTWMRWGRVGYRGQSSLKCHKDLEEAKRKFSEKFSAKTGNDWSGRASFKAIPGKYSIVATKYDVPETDEEEECKKESLQASKLDVRIQNLMGLITNLDQVRKDVMKLEYDFTKCPLGSLSAEKIQEGYTCLKEIEAAIAAKNFGSPYLENMKKYYDVIAHVFVFRPPPLIKTEEEFKKELRLLETLNDVQVSCKVLRRAREQDDRRAPVDRFYDGMNCQMRPLGRNSKVFKMVSKYLSSTHGSTHLFTMEILNVFSVYKEDEFRRFNSSVGNRMLLWHGSRVSNFYNILSYGLRIAPPEASSTGYMFGKGVYFADVASQSANYCFPAPGKCVLLMLCEVALGNSQLLRNANYSADKQLGDKNSTFGIGKFRANEKNCIIINDGVRVPYGPLESHEDDGTSYSLMYNEYVVYDTAQIRSRYIVEVKFDM